MKKFFTILCALAIILIPSTLSASEMLLEASGSYIMDSHLDETPASATARAREEAKRAVVEKAGVYLQTYSKTVDFTLDIDEVQTVAARLLKIQEESSNVEVVEENLLKFTVTIKALVDDLDENDLKALMRDKKTLAELTRKNKELQKKYDALNQEMMRYRNQFNSASKAGKIGIKKDVARNIERFYAVNEFAKGNEFSFRKEYERALSFYDAAVKLDPQLAEAYNNRGIVKYELGQFSEAVKDYTQALKLKSNYADALNNRGNAYAVLEQFQNAEKDLRAALKLNDKSASIHNNFGNICFSQNKFNAAVDEYTQALNLNPNLSEAYYNRAVAYYLQNKLAEALTDLKKAFFLNVNDATSKELYEKISRQLNEKS